MDSWATAALWVALALGASLVSIRVGISVALIEIFFGVIGGNFLHMHPSAWINFLAGFGSVLLTFLAGAEIDPETLRRRAKESFSIGIAAFLLPFAGIWLVVQYGLHWPHNAAIIAGIALSTTSVAVVYAVMVETGLNTTELGKILLAACFINDLGTVLALGVFFASYNIWLVVFMSVTALVIALTPKVARWFFEQFGGHVSEPEIKFIFLLLFGLGALATKANSEPVLGAYLLGLVVASIFAERKTMVSHLRTTSFALLTPFYFIKAGMLVSLPSVWTGAGLIGLLLGLKIATKFIGVLPLARFFKFPPREQYFSTLLMCTGLTFGSISAMFGLSRGLITKEQYTWLVITVIASAVVPTMIAMRHFRPTMESAALVRSTETVPEMATLTLTKESPYVHEDSTRQ